MQAEGQIGKRELGTLLARIARNDPAMLAQFLHALEKSEETKPIQAQELQQCNLHASEERNGVLNSKSTGVLKSESENSQSELLREGDGDSAKHPPNFSLPKSAFEGKRVERNIHKNLPEQYAKRRVGELQRIAPGLIRGAGAICAFLGINRVTLLRWISDYDFPSAHLPDGCLVTTPTLIDAWVAVAIERERNRKNLIPEKQNGHNYLMVMRRITGFRVQPLPHLAKVSDQ